MKWQVDVLEGEWNSKLTKCWTYETTSSLNDEQMKQQVDEMAGV